VIKTIIIFSLLCSSVLASNQIDDIITIEFHKRLIDKEIRYIFYNFAHKYEKEVFLQLLLVGEPYLIYRHDFQKAYLENADPSFSGESMFLVIKLFKEKKIPGILDIKTYDSENRIIFKIAPKLLNKDKNYTCVE